MSNRWLAAILFITAFLLGMFWLHHHIPLNAIDGVAKSTVVSVIAPTSRPTPMHSAPNSLQSPEPPRPEVIKASADAAEAAAQAAANISGHN